MLLSLHFQAGWHLARPVGSPLTHASPPLTTTMLLPPPARIAAGGSVVIAAGSLLAFVRERIVREKTEAERDEEIASLRRAINQRDVQV